MRTARSAKIAAIAITAALGMSACAAPAEPPADNGAGRIVAQSSIAPRTYAGTLIEDPPMQRPALTLPDTNGEPFNFAQRPDDEVTVVFFGYTHCPDVCPMTMADLAAARRAVQLELREQLKLVFVTEDPKRDTPPALRTWLDRFDPAIVGLIGGNEQTKQALRSLYLPATGVLPNPPGPIQHPHSDGSKHTHGNYLLDHTGIFYAFGPRANTVVYTGGTTVDEYAEDFERLARTAH